MKARLIVSAVIEQGSTILFGRKNTNTGPYPNTWHLIGGGINIEEESMFDAIRREIREEAGIEVESIEKLFFNEDYEPDKHGEITHYIFLVFRAAYESGTAQPSDDIVQLSWIDKNDLRNLELNRPTKQLFEAIGYL